MNCDVAIIGGGAAGISSALWCDDLELSAIILEAESEFGGQLLWTFNEIKNYLGIEVKNGRELRDIFVKQIENRKFQRKLNAEVSEIDTVSKTIYLKNGEIITSKAIIIASGVRRRKLNVEGEIKFQNKGIIRSGKRDSETAEGKNVLIIGGGDAAFENALILAEKAASVTVAYRGNRFRARNEFVEKAENNPKIKILTDTIIKKILGKEQVEKAETENLKTKEKSLLQIEIVLIRIGVEPNVDFIKGKINLDKNGYIKINENCETSEENIFAVGDAANPFAPTISSAVGMGATAVKTIWARLNL